MSSEETPIIDPSLTLSLRPEEDQDELSASTQAYRLIKIGKDVLVYGGEDGILQRADNQKMVRKWDDDAIRALAVSPNERTVAVGFDTGEVQIYDFDDHNNASEDTEHPFCAAPTNHPDADDAFLSQSDTFSSPRSNDTMRRGPTQESGIRDLLFLNDKFLAVASESGLTIVDLAEADMPEYLNKEVKKEHGGSGVRGLAWNTSVEILTTLGMDGSVGFWACPLADTDSWKLWRKEPNIKVLKKDIGEILGADPWDRSTRPCQHGSHLAIPGVRAWQLVRWTSTPDVDYRELFQDDTVHHASSMVVHCARGSQWISTDRAGVIALWELKSEKMKEQSRLNCGEGSAPTDVLWTKKKLWIITADGRILLWDVDALPKPTETSSDRPAIAKDDEVENKAEMGALTVRETDPGRSTVDIDFTDSAFRRPISFTDTIGFILGSLGEDGAILASDVPEGGDEENDLGDVVEGVQISETIKAALKKSRKKETASNGSTIYFRRYETFANKRDKDWYLTLPAGERVLGCATGQGWAAVVTHRRFVRLFTPGGNQGPVLWIEGDPVTMVGRSRFLAVVYHQSAPLADGTQKMGYTLYDGVSGRVVTKGPLSCLSSQSTLQWVGFSSDSSLMAMDSDGMLSMLVSSAEMAAHWEWMPVLDTMALRKSSEDTHWPIHVSDGKLICVPLKGGVKNPDVVRRPVTSTLGLRLPLARGPLTQTHAVEELSIRAAISLHQRKVVQQITFPGQPQDEEDEEFAKEYCTLSAQVDKVTLKLFASLVEAGKLERAFDLMERLHLERSFEVAMKIADRHRKLVDKIEEVRDLKFPLEEEDEDEQEGDLEYDATNSPPEVTAGLGRPRISPDADAGRHPKRAFGSWDSAGRKTQRIS
eukprot:scaffold935_cov155-Amphora_coffeaeformis.AAC.1